MLREELDQMLKIQHPKLIKNIQILDNTMLGQDFVMRIDQQRMDRKGFVPMIAHRQAGSEDRTLPRVVTADTLLGCIKAYPNIVNEYNNYIPGEEGYDKLGYYIHGINFEYCLKPNNKLVYDADKTGEIWLPRYNNATNIYYPKIIGKIFLKSYKAEAYVGVDLHKIISEFYIEVIKDSGLKFNNKIFLKKGYHSVIVNYADTSLNGIKDITHTDITKEEFLNNKKLHSTLESMPIYTKW